MAHGEIEEDSVVGQEAVSDHEGKEYTDMDYAFDETHGDKEDDKDVVEVLDEPLPQECSKTSLYHRGTPLVKLALRKRKLLLFDNSC